MSRMPSKRGALGFVYWTSTAYYSVKDRGRPTETLCVSCYGVIGTNHPFCECDACFARIHMRPDCMGARGSVLCTECRAGGEL